MHVTFHGQPFRDFGGWSADWLVQQLDNSDISEIQIAVAWIKRSALLRLTDKVQEFRMRGGVVSAVVGIDEGGATEQGLRVALELLDTIYVFHDPTNRTFHPKVYLARGKTTAELLVGSNNMTAGGLYSNYEAAILCKFDLETDEDARFLAQLLEWFETLKADSGACKLLDAHLLETLLTDPLYNIQDEGSRRTGNVTADHTDSSIVDSPDTTLFKVPKVPLTGMAPRLRSDGKLSSKAEPDRLMSTEGSDVHENPRPSETSTPVTRSAAYVGEVLWRKVMSKSDAQHPTEVTSKVTGNLKLSQAGFDIDIETYFRDDMFGELTWEAAQTTRGTKETTTALFKVIINGIDNGYHHLRIDHATYRIAAQNNVPTWLHWGPLMPILRATDFTGFVVEIRRARDDSYILEIYK